MLKRSGLSRCRSETTVRVGNGRHRWSSADRETSGTSFAEITFAEALDWANFYSLRLRKFIDLSAVLSVRHGRLVGRAWRHQLITMPEPMSRRPEHGVDTLCEVKATRTAGDGGAEQFAPTVTARGSRASRLLHLVAGDELTTDFARRDTKVPANLLFV
jgi:hypothetical protein